VIDSLVLLAQKPRRRKKSLKTSAAFVIIGAASIFSLALSPAAFALDAAIDEQPSKLGSKICDEAESVMAKATDVAYKHAHADAKGQVAFSPDGSCICRNDCSGFVSYLLDLLAPKHYQEIHELQADKEYPQAKIFAEFFRQLEASKNDRGWLRIDRVDQLKRGDFIAWEKPVQPGAKPGNSGHVAIVEEPPEQIKTERVGGETIRYAVIPVIDSSSVNHFPPEQLPPHAGQSHRDGVGRGCVRLLVDNDNHPVGYWEGTFWNEGGKVIEHPTLTPEIGCARPLGMRE
jgi:hypothetical protein